MNGLDEEENKMINTLWARYHDGGLPDLPPQVYFDFGWFHGLVSKLSQRVDELEKSHSYQESD